MSGVAPRTVSENVWGRSTPPVGIAPVTLAYVAHSSTDSISKMLRDLTPTRHEYVTGAHDSVLRSMRTKTCDAAMEEKSGNFGHKSSLSRSFHQTTEPFRFLARPPTQTSRILAVSRTETSRFLARPPTQTSRILAVSRTETLRFFAPRPPTETFATPNHGCKPLDLLSIANPKTLLKSGKRSTKYPARRRIWDLFRRQTFSPIHNAPPAK